MLNAPKKCQSCHSTPPSIITGISYLSKRFSEFDAEVNNEQTTRLFCIEAKIHKPQGLVTLPGLCYSRPLIFCLWREAQLLLDCGCKPQSNREPSRFLPAPLLPRQSNLLPEPSPSLRGDKRSSLSIVCLYRRSNLADLTLHCDTLQYLQYPSILLQTTIKKPPEESGGLKYSHEKQKM